MLKEDESKRNLIIFAFSLMVSLAFLLICTKSSPLYPLNDWGDSNAFFTVGKGMMNGVVPYRDLFEQKGPYLYLIHGLAYMISNTTFLGIFVFEVISFSMFLFFSYRIALIYLDLKYAIFTIPLIAVLILNLQNFQHGDSAEEFCLPLLALSLYYLIDYFTDVYPGNPGKKILLLNGVIAGVVLWTKASLLGFWFGWIVSIFICMAINKEYFKALQGIFVYLVGMFLATLPWIIYFGINHSIIPWLKTYLYINAVCYCTAVPLVSLIKYIFMHIVGYASASPIFGFVLIFGILVFVSSDKFIMSKLNRTCLLLCMLLLALGVYGGGRGYIYYFLIFTPFVVLGFISLLFFFRNKYDPAISFETSVSIAMISLLIALPLTYLYNHNTYMLFMNKQDLVQYKFALIIKQTENATLLNYGSLDNGFYTAANIVPRVKYFHKPNIDDGKLPIIMEEQNRYIKDKEIDFVVISETPSQISLIYSIPYLFENYELIADEKQKFDKNGYQYSLFKVKKLEK